MINIDIWGDAVKAVKRGELIVFPTDTVYGIGCDPRNSNALELLFTAKKRPKEKSIPVLVDSIKTAESLGEISSHCKFLLKKYWPGALTVVVKKREDSGISKVLSKNDTIALRMPFGKELLGFLSSVGGALAVTSANISGEPPLSTGEEARAVFAGTVSVIIPGSAQTKKPSTITDCTGTKPKLLRQGDVFIEDIF